MTEICVAALQLPLGGTEQENIVAVSGLVHEAADRDDILLFGAAQGQLQGRYADFCHAALLPPQGSFLNSKVMRSDSPIASYLALSVSPRPSRGGNVHTPFS